MENDMLQDKKLTQIGNKCTACGTCAKVCLFKAITVHKGYKVVIDKNKCVNCEKCVKACPASIYNYQGYTGKKTRIWGTVGFIYLLIWILCLGI